MQSQHGDQCHRVGLPEDHSFAEATEILAIIHRVLAAVAFDELQGGEERRAFVALLETVVLADALQEADSQSDAIVLTFRKPRR